MNHKSLVACLAVAATLTSALTLFRAKPAAEPVEPVMLMAQNTPPAAPKVEFPAASPQSTVKQRVGVTDIEITYSRPGVKGRKIFGGLEQFGKVWRTGANNATKVTFSTDITFGGTKVAAGSYGLFTIPGETEWAVILNKVPGQWGAYRYEAKDDVLRVTVKPVKVAELIETFTIDVNDVRDGSATLNLSWEHTRVSVPLAFDLSGVVAQVDALISSTAEKKPSDYAQAAMFFFENNVDLAKAEAWMDEAIKLQPSAFYLIYRKGLIQEKRGDKAGALASATKSLEMAEKDTSPAKDEYVRLNSALISRVK